jgi:hypothetical protein
MFNIGRSLPQLDFTFSNYENIKSRLIASNAIAAFTIIEELDLGDRPTIQNTTRSPNYSPHKNAIA